MIGENGLTGTEERIGLRLLHLWEQDRYKWRITAWPQRRGVKLTLWSLAPASDFSRPDHPMRRWQHVWPDGSPGDGMMAPPYGVWEGRNASVYVSERLSLNRWRKTFEERIREGLRTLEDLVCRYEQRELDQKSISEWAVSAR